MNTPLVLSRRSSPALALAVSVTGLAMPAAAGAATITLDRSCYVEQTAMTVTGSGFPAGANVTLSGGGIFETVVADAAGGFATVVAAPINPTLGAKESDIDEQELQAQFFTDSAQTASASYRLTNFAYSVSDATGNPRKKRTFYLAGFPTDSTVYAHYRIGGKTRGVVRFGKAQGPCGLITAKQALLPRSIPLRYGTWKIQWDNKRSYDAKALPRLTTNLSIYRTFR